MPVTTTHGLEVEATAEANKATVRRMLERLFYRWMNRGIDERDPFALSLRSEFLWHPARQEPEFQNLLRRVGLA